ncbi:hypothetical protein MFIFM68171_06750 [Madurella fahalii]|uniref:C3H1-type domain-containing protein n=1 Tax=Madurella fahalii TaxID=1157608 RepID=A0ABQ0GFS3_9PEZI
MANIPDGFGDFLDQFRAQTDDNLRRMTELNNQLSDLARQYTDVCRDLERERVAGRYAQEHAEMAERKLKDVEESVLRSAFVLVLVDADADSYLFDEKYYAADAAEGGERAATDLRSSVRHYVQSIDPDFASLPVVAKAFASGEGLAHLIAKAGIAKAGDSQRVLSRFTCGFSQADDMFDFVLVGKGKDRADHKLIGTFRQFVENPSCKHILLACCHDNGYVRMLEKYVYDPTVVGKVTMIKSPQAGSEFSALPFGSTTMDPVFTGWFRSGGAGSHRAAKTPAVSETGRNSPPPTTYASRAGVLQQATAPPESKPRPLPLFGTVGSDVIVVNADGHRLDLPLPPKSAAVSESFNRKTYGGGKRFCNMHHLYGWCSGNCGYLHGQLTAGEKLVMRHRLRLEKCHDRGKCRDPLCFYGHHCACHGQAKKCNFPASMHGVDTAGWKEVSASASSV